VLILLIFAALYDHHVVCTTLNKFHYNKINLSVYIVKKLAFEYPFNIDKQQKQVEVSQFYNS